MTKKLSPSKTNRPKDDPPKISENFSASEKLPSGNIHWDMSLDEVLSWWDTIDKGGTDLAGVRALCLTDRYYLLVKVCRRVDMLHPWIYARCREVERAPDDHLDLWAREHYKSTIITFGGTMQEILRNPEITACIFSHVSAIAKAFLVQIKQELESNEILKAAFPDVLYSNPSKQAPKWSIDGGIVVKRKGNPKEATLESSGLVDGQPISKHYRLRVYDDVVTDASVYTPDQIKKTTDAYSLSQSLGMEGGREWMIGTRYSYADTYQWVLDRGALTERIYPATENGHPDGELVLLAPDYWKKLKLRLTDNDIACQYMQNPLSGQQRMFNIEDLVEYEVRPEVLNVYIMCDPARSKKKDSDKTAMIVLGVDHNLNKYLLDGFNHKMNLKERWENFHRLFTRWKNAPGVQNVKMGYESFGAQADLDYFEEQMRLPKYTRFDIMELAWPREGEGSKVDRVQRLVPDCKSHKLYLPYPTSEHRFTALQKRMVASGYSHRVSQLIRKLDENGNAYDLTKDLRMQFHFFPFGGKKDAIDATSRIYDMEIVAPRGGEPNYIEPEFN